MYNIYKQNAFTSFTPNGSPQVGHFRCLDLIRSSTQDSLYSEEKGKEGVFKDQVVGRFVVKTLSSNAPKYLPESMHAFKNNVRFEIDRACSATQQSLEKNYKNNYQSVMPQSFQQFQHPLFLFTLPDAYPTFFLTTKVDCSSNYPPSSSRHRIVPVVAPWHQFPHPPALSGRE